MKCTTYSAPSNNVKRVPLMCLHDKKKSTSTAPQRNTLFRESNDILWISLALSKEFAEWREVRLGSAVRISYGLSRWMSGIGI